MSAPSDSKYVEEEEEDFYQRSEKVKERENSIFIYFWYCRKYLF